MTSTTSQTAQRKNLVLVKDSNEWGQITELEANTTYFVIRKPTREMTKERSREFVEDVRAFLHEHRVLSEQQMNELNSRYGEPAKAKAKEIREVLERKFDEIAKEFELRVEQLEKEFGTVAERFQKKETPASGATEAPAQSPVSTTPVAETPGEMPSGEGTPAPVTASDAPSSKKKGSGAKKPE